MAIGIQLNIVGDLLQGFKWGQITVDWVIHKTLWEPRDLSWVWRWRYFREAEILSFVHLFDCTRCCSWCWGRQRMRLCGPVRTLPHELAHMDLPWGLYPLRTLPVWTLPIGTCHGDLICVDPAHVDPTLWTYSHALAHVDLPQGPYPCRSTCVNLLMWNCPCGSCLCGTAMGTSLSSVKIDKKVSKKDIISYGEKCCDENKEDEV